MYFNCYYCGNEYRLVEAVYDDDNKEYCCLHHKHLQRGITTLNACEICASNRGDQYLGLYLVKKRSPSRPYFNSKNNKRYYVSRGDNKIYTQDYPRN